MKELQENTYVRYGSNGICQVLGRETLCSSGQPATYYVLRPVAEDQAVIYLPAENESLLARVFPVLSREEADGLICASHGERMVWDPDRRSRTRLFSDILKNGDPSALLAMVNCIYRQKQELEAARKKLPASDDNALRRAERSLQRDLAFVLDIPEQQVGPYIRARLGID